MTLNKKRVCFTGYPYRSFTQETQLHLKFVTNIFALTAKRYNDTTFDTE